MPNYHGKWNLIHDKEDLEMIPDNPAVDYKLFKILRLKNDELWLQREVKPDSLVQFNLAPQANN